MWWRLHLPGWSRSRPKYAGREPRFLGPADCTGLTAACGQDSGEGQSGAARPAGPGEPPSARSLWLRGLHCTATGSCQAGALFWAFTGPFCLTSGLIRGPRCQAGLSCLLAEAGAWLSGGRLLCPPLHQAGSLGGIAGGGHQLRAACSEWGHRRAYTLSPKASGTCLSSCCPSTQQRKSLRARLGLGWVDSMESCSMPGDLSSLRDLHEHMRREGAGEGVRGSGQEACKS